MRPAPTLLLSLLLSAPLSGCVGDGARLEGDGRIARESRAVAALAALEVEGRPQLDMDVDVQVGAAPGLTVEADGNLLPSIHAEARGGTLRLWSDRDTRGTQPVRVRYTVPRLERLETTGGADVHVSGLAGGTLHVVQRGSGRVELRGRVDHVDAVNSGSGSLLADALETAGARLAQNGSGRVAIGSVRGDALQAQVYGSGGLSARGEVHHVEVAIHGSGDARLAGLRADEADLATNGSGAIAIAVTGRVSTHTNGSGTITVYGDPAERNVAGKSTTFVR